MQRRNSWKVALINNTIENLQVHLLNHLLKQNKLVANSVKNSQDFEQDNLRLAQDYHKILTNPDQIVEDFNKANKYENDIRISKKKRRRTMSARPASKARSIGMSCSRIKERPKRGYMEA